MRILSTFLALGFCMAAADDAARTEQQRLVAAIVNVISEQDTYAACREIERGRSPLQAAELYHAAAQSLYHQHKNVRSMVALSRAGIHLALSESERVAPADPEQAATLRGLAKTIAYDLGANLWPGWQDEGIVHSPADLVTGLEAARLNLRLAEELGRPALPRCNAHWLLGAHELARGESAAARQQFDLAREQAEAAGKPDYVHMCGGYSAIARLQQVRGDAAADRGFAAAVQSLRDLQSDDASYFADQLTSVRALYAGAPSEPRPSGSGQVGVSQ